MSRCLGAVGAAALLLAAAGCSMDSLFMSFSASSRRDERGVMLSVDQAKTSLCASLSARGVKFFESSDNGVVHIKGETQLGKHFDFSLESQKSMGGATTLVAFEGDKEAETLWFAVINSIDGPGPPQRGDEIHQQGRPIQNVTPAGSPVQDPMAPSNQYPFQGPRQ